MAYATDMSGIKAYSYGGIRVRKDGLGETAYEYRRDRIINLIQEKCVTEEGTHLLAFIGRREEVYEGPQLSAYPDIVLELTYGWGIGQSIGSTLFGRSAVTSLMPGSHRRATPVLLVRGRGKQTPKGGKVHMTDIAPTVLDLLGLPYAEDLDGKSIYRSGRDGEAPERRSLDVWASGARV